MPILFALTALGALFLPSAAPAATLEGRILYPGRAIPAATVYARNVESEVLHRAALGRNEASFRLELPAGSYWIFVRPEEPGLRELYGAHTRYSRCRQNPSPLTDTCSDHAACLNTYGSFSCICNSGYEGDGETCEPHSGGCAASSPGSWGLVVLVFGLVPVRRRRRR